MVEALASGAAPSLPSYDPEALAELMGREGLLAALTHGSPTVRQFGAYHLGAVCRPSDEDALGRVAADADASVSSAAIVTLARCGMPSARARVAAALSAGHERWNGLYSAMRDQVGAPGLALLLPHAPSPAIYRTLVQELGALGDPRAGSVLFDELARLESPSARDRLDAGVALADASDPRILEALEPLLAGAEPDHARAAIELLARSALPSEVAPRLLGLAQREGALRTAAIDALAELGACGDEVQRALHRVLGQRSGRASALRALGRCGDAQALDLARRDVAQPLTPPVSDEAGQLRLAALDVVAARGLSELAPTLFEQAIDPATDARVRTAIADALGEIAPDPIRDRALERLTDPEQPRPVRAAMRRILGLGTARASVPRLIGFVRGGEDDARTTDAAVLLGLAHHAESRDELVGLLTDSRARATAALALALGGDATSARAVARLVRADDAVASRLARHLQEPPWSFAESADDALFAHLASAFAARDAGYALPASKLCGALSRPPAGLRSPAPHALRRTLRGALAESEDAARRGLAADALRCMDARGALLFVRDRGGVGAAEARRALSVLRAASER